MEEALKLSQTFFEAIAKNDPAILQPVGGLGGLRARFLNLMQSGEDDTVSGFAARVLAVTGGARYAPHIAALMNKRDASWTEEDTYPAPTSRGQAAIALSIIPAMGYKKNIAALLTSMNVYDRSGASFALGEMRAIEYADEIAGLLSQQEFTFRRDESPIHALIKMGVGSNYKKEIAAALNDDFSSEVNEAAAYALAHLNAIEYSGEIAKLLNHEFRRRTAAKVLALMGRREYTPRIAALLAVDSSLDRSAALLALGILNAREYAPQAAMLMRRERKTSVSYYAALSLVLMRAKEYRREVLEVLKVNKTGKYVDSDLNPIVAERAEQIEAQIGATIRQFKTRRLGTRRN
ncbi:MAG TPA: hypothetical protein VJT71_13760 [Pyrinomonadaceae bacterium]|nr:hypothetical protein [Pyrinomonadaceae bacterium]